MTRVDFYNGSECLCEIGIQGDSTDRTQAVTAVTPEITLAYIQSLRITPQENITAIKPINSGNGMNVTKFIKGMHQTDVEMSFWLPKDLDQTTPMEVWLLKMAFDGTDSVSESTQDTYTVPDSADEYGDDYLKVMTIEAGYNKSGSVTAHKVTGACVQRANFHWEKTLPFVATYSMNALKGEKITSFTAGTLTEASEEPFTWGDTLFAYGDAGSSATQNNINMVDLNIEYVLDMVADMANATSSRTGLGWKVNKRNVTGQIQLDLTTETDNGQDLWEDYYNDATGTASPTEGVQLKDLFITMYQSASYNIVIQLHNLVITNIPDELTGEGVPSITLDFNAQNAVLIFKVLGTSSAPTNWSEV